jgi:hypothetical protein
MGQNLLMAICVLKMEIIRLQKMLTKSIYISLSTDSISD